MKWTDRGDGKCIHGMGPGQCASCAGLTRQGKAKSTGRGSLGFVYARTRAVTTIYRREVKDDKGRSMLLLLPT